VRRRFAFITVLTLAAASPAAALDRLVDIGNVRWVEVTGEGSVNAPPDFARVALGVTNTGKTAGEAMAANANAANALVSLIKSEGVAPADIQTSEVSISPMFSQPARGQQTAPTITGYSVSNNVAVTLRDIPRLGNLLDKAVTAGANSIYGIGFDHNDPSALLDNARGLAVADARRKAKLYATGAGARLGRLLTLAEASSRPPPIVRYFPRAFAADAAAAPTPIEAGEDKLTVTVLARFELAE
jgi:uncharacterized protein YggE